MRLPYVAVSGRRGRREQLGPEVTQQTPQELSDGGAVGR
jgi:hypothetical protein